MSRHVLNFVRACPATTAVIVVAVALAAGEAFHRATQVESTGSRHALGGVDMLHYEKQPELYGPLALWEGDWWRIPVSAFHHGGSSGRVVDPSQWLHLGMNCLTLAFLGWLLEPRMLRPVYLLFVLAAAVVSVLPEFLLENLVFGLSGAACAQFGALLVLRQRDPGVAERLPAAVVGLGFAWLALCIPLTLLEIAPIANVAHFTGLAYGWLGGQAFFGRAANVAGRLAFATAHLLVVPGLYAATHPEWIGRYHWYLARLETDSDRQAERWQQALQRDPRLGELWRELAEHQLHRGRRLEAWRTILAGLDANRDFDRGDRFARGLWRLLRVNEATRDQARQILAEQFGPEEPAWRERLGIPPAALLAAADLELLDSVLPQRPEPEPDLSRFRLDQRIELAPAAGDSPRPRDLTAPPVDPDAADSAVLGTPL